MKSAPISLLIALVLLLQPARRLSASTQDVKALTVSAGIEIPQVRDATTQSKDSKEGRDESTITAAISVTTLVQTAAKKDQRNLLRIAVVNTAFLFLVATALVEIIAPPAAYAEFAANSSNPDPLLQESMLSDKSIALTSYLTPTINTFIGTLFVALNNGNDATTKGEVVKKYTIRQAGYSLRLGAAFQGLLVASKDLTPLDSAYLAVCSALIIGIFCEMVNLEGTLPGKVVKDWQDRQDPYIVRSSAKVRKDNLRYYLPLVDLVAWNSFFGGALAGSLLLSENQPFSSANVKVVSALGGATLFAGTTLNWTTYHLFSKMLRPHQNQGGTSALLTAQLAAVMNATSAILFMNFFSVEKRSTVENAIVGGSVPLLFFSLWHAIFQSQPLHVHGLKKSSKKSSFLNLNVIPRGSKDSKDTKEEASPLPPSI